MYPLAAEPLGSGREIDEREEAGATRTSLAESAETTAKAYVRLPPSASYHEGSVNVKLVSKGTPVVGEHTNVPLIGGELMARVIACVTFRRPSAKLNVNEAVEPAAKEFGPITNWVELYFEVK
eukprot:GILK01015344.1.p1 GENE.GILK01015344.1~~GILK01015344.1.p1  ORF type:complete len:123 (-),score=2.79 GILK01015344.1:136-504(-)